MFAVSAVFVDAQQGVWATSRLDAALPGIDGVSQTEPALQVQAGIAWSGNSIEMTNQVREGCDHCVSHVEGHALYFDPGQNHVANI